MYRSRWRSLSASKKFCAASCVRVCKSPQKLSCNSATKCWKCSVIGIIFAMGVGLLFWNGFSLRGQSQLTPSCFLHNRIYVTARPTTGPEQSEKLDHERVGPVQDVGVQIGVGMPAVDVEVNRTGFKADSSKSPGNRATCSGKSDRDIEHVVGSYLGERPGDRAVFEGVTGRKACAVVASAWRKGCRQQNRLKVERALDGSSLVPRNGGDRASQRRKGRRGKSARSRTGEIAAEG